MPEAALTAATIYDSGPVLELGGRREPQLERELLAMEMREQEGGLSSLELRFLNVATHERGGAVDFAFEYGDTDLLGLGRAVRVAAGDAADPVELFRGRISAVELAVEEDGTPELIVQAEDALMARRMARFTRLHPAGPLRDILSDVATAAGLRPVISGLDQRVSAQAQMNESDLAFLRRLLADYDADLQVAGEEVHIAPRSEVRRGEVTLALGFQLYRVHAAADLAHQVSKVTFSGFDVGQGRKIKVESGGPSLALGPGRGRTGAEILEAAFGGARAEHMGDRHAADEAEARVLADAAFARLARRFVTASGTAAGNPAIRVGTHLTLDGLGPRFSNTYYVTAACHRFDRTQGYLTEFEAECARFGG